MLPAANIFRGKYAADAALAKKILRTSPDAGTKEQLRLFREAGGEKSGVIHYSRRRMGLTCARAKTGDAALAKKMLHTSPDADTKKQTTPTLWRPKRERVCVCVRERERALSGTVLDGGSRAAPINCDGLKKEV